MHCHPFERANVPQMRATRSAGEYNDENDDDDEDDDVSVGCTALGGGMMN